MIGSILGNRYEILEKIGEGGMSLVYKAKCSLLQRMVTVKVLRPQYTCDEDFIKRFHREAQAVASLSHPNIVGVYDVGRDGEYHYMVMEYIEGDNLKNIIRQGAPLPVSEAVNIAKQICEGLDHAHENGIIHRDIKSHNILITKNGRVKVTDFGIARLVTSATVTHTGTIVGSVHYFSPEQARGEATTTLSDIYSLGVVLYEMLTGKVPFEGDSPIAIALKQIQEEPVAPTKINPGISKELEKVILRAMDKDTKNRYQSAQQLNNDLKTVLSGEISEETRVLQIDEFATRVLPKADLLAMQQNAHAASKDDDLVKEEEPKKKKRRINPLIFAIIGVIILGFGIGAFAAMGGLLNTKEVTVPNIVGKTYEEAKSILEDAGLKVKKVDEVYNNQYEQGVVVSQEPGADKKVKEGREILLTVSKGKKTATLPEVAGTDFDEAKLLIEGKGFTNVDDTPLEEYSDIEKGKVIRIYEYSENEDVPLDAPIKIVVSQGPEIKELQMPNLVGMTKDQASAELQRLNLKIGTITKVESQEEVNTVIEQSVSKGKTINEGTAIDITISSGPSQPLTKEEMVTVTPDVDGIIKINLVDESGKETTQYSAVVKAGKVVNQKIRYTGNASLKVYLNDSVIEERILP